MTSLYIHIPFCLRKCFYCSFSVSVAQEHRMEEYVAALAQEARKDQGEKIDTVYFGGGTPSMLTAPLWERLLIMIRKIFHLSPECVMTVEANPENIDLQKAKLLSALGVNRISLGVQTLSDHYLKYLGRVHDSSKAFSAFDDLRRAGFNNINIDLMYSFPGQTSVEIEQDVKTVLSLGSEHVSIYTLTVEENSKFFAQRIKEQDDHDQGDQYQQVTDLLNAGGILQYEVSNFCRPGYESKHNINYWLGGNYIGLGMSSHSHHDGRRSWNISTLSDYLKKIAAGESPEQGSETLDPPSRLREALVFGLRMNRGVHLDALEKKFVCKLTKDLRAQIEILKEHGFLMMSAGRLQASAHGRLQLDDIAVRLI